MPQPDSRTTLLAAIGLKPRMVWRDTGPPIYDESAFITYTEQAYLDSPIAEMDEVYRMHSHVLLHRATGLRVRVSTSENYFGDEVDHKVDEVVVRTLAGKELKVIGLDLEAGLITTDAGPLPIAEVDKQVPTVRRPKREE